MFQGGKLIFMDKHTQLRKIQLSLVAGLYILDDSQAMKAGRHDSFQVGSVKNLMLNLTRRKTLHKDV